MNNNVVLARLNLVFPLATALSLACGSEVVAQATRYTSPYQSAAPRYAPVRQDPVNPSIAAPTENMGILVLGLGLAVGAVAGLSSGGSSGSGEKAIPSDPPSPLPPVSPAPPNSSPPSSSPPETTLPPADLQLAEPGPPERLPWKRSPEFEHNYALDLINAEHRYADGATGNGTLVAIFDTGVKLDHVDLTSQIDHDLSWNYFTNARGVEDIDGHGSHVASIVAGARNGRGAHGVAFEADLMILKGLPDAQTTQAPDARMTFANAQLRASTAGAVAINHSWSFTDSQGRSQTIDQFQTATKLRHFYGADLVSALERSAADGLVSVFATANDGHKHPSVTAGAAIHLSEAVRRHTLAVTAIDEAGTITNWANRCGLARDFCLAAPGDQIKAAGIHSETAIYSGTSMAAPHVAGAVALLKSSFPELTGSEIATILLETARDAGASGPDDIYGRGILDLENAIAPQGRITIPAGDTIHAPSYELDQSGIAADGALGRALKAATRGREIMVSDAYDRGYSMALSTFLKDEEIKPLDTQGLRTFTQRMTAEPIATDGSRALHLGGAEGWADGEALTMPFAHLVEAPRLTYTDRIGAYELSISGARAEDGAIFTAAGLGFEAGAAGLRVTLGSIRERGALLGSDVSGGMGEDITTHTDFASLGLDLALSTDTQIQMNGSLGRSSFASSGIMRSGEDISTSSLSLGLATANIVVPGDQITIGLARNFSIRSGQIGFDMPVAMMASKGRARSEAILRKTSYVEMNEATAPTDLQAGYSRDFGRGRLAGGAIWRFDEGGDAAALSVGYTIRF